MKRRAQETLLTAAGHDCGLWFRAMQGDDETWVKSFGESLPGSYRNRYKVDEIRIHAAIARSRNGSPARIGVVPVEGDGLGICVVARDAPGLFSNIAAALRLQGFDIVHAEAYTRKLPSGDREVLDLFRLQPQQGRPPVASAATDIAAAISATLHDILAGKVDPSQAQPAPQQEPAGTSHDTRVRFIEDDDGALCTLEVETDDRSGLLFTLARALSNQKVSVERSEVSTVNSRVFDRFTLAEQDGSPITEARRLHIQVAVISAIEALAWSPRYSQRPN
jgi:[protein-PII] uridylyltransferase